MPMADFISRCAFSFRYFFFDFDFISIIILLDYFFFCKYFREAAVASRLFLEGYFHFSFIISLDLTITDDDDFCFFRLFRFSPENAGAWGGAFLIFFHRLDTPYFRLIFSDASPLLRFDAGKMISTFRLFIFFFFLLSDFLLSMQWMCGRCRGRCKHFFVSFFSCRCHYCVLTPMLFHFLRCEPPSTF